MFKRVVVPAKAGIQISLSWPWIPVPHFREDKFHGNDRKNGPLKRFASKSQTIMKFIIKWRRKGKEDIALDEPIDVIKALRLKGGLGESYTYSSFGASKIY